MLTRDNILGADDLPREEVAIPEWGGTAWVRAVMADELDAFEASCLNGSSKPSLKNLRAKFCAMVLCDSEAIGCSMTPTRSRWGRKVRQRWTAFSRLGSD